MEVYYENIKDKVISSISSMPENCTYEDILYNIYIMQKFELGLNDFVNNDYLSNEQVEKELEQWLM